MNSFVAMVYDMKTKTGENDYGTLLEFVQKYESQSIVIPVPEGIVVQSRGKGSKKKDSVDGSDDDVRAVETKGETRLDEDGYLTRMTDESVRFLYVLSHFRDPSQIQGRQKPAKTRSDFVHALSSLNSISKLLTQHYNNKHTNIYVLNYVSMRQFVFWKPTKFGCQPHVFASRLDDGWIVDRYHVHPSEKFHALLNTFIVSVSVLRTSRQKQSSVAAMAQIASSTESVGEPRSRGKKLKSVQQEPLGETVKSRGDARDETVKGKEEEDEKEEKDEKDEKDEKERKDETDAGVQSQGKNGHAPLVQQRQERETTLEEEEKAETNSSQTNEKQGKEKDEEQWEQVVNKRTGKRGKSGKKTAFSGKVNKN